MTVESMLTTVDNPYDPFTEYDEWFTYDSMSGYYTPSFLARITVMSDAMSEADQALAIELAIDEIVKENVSGMYRKVTREVDDASGTDVDDPSETETIVEDSNATPDGVVV